MDRNEKIDATMVALRQYKEADLQSLELDAQIKELQTRKKEADKIAQTAHDAIDAILQDLEVKQLALESFTVYYRKSSALKVTDEAQIPAEFWKQVPKRLDAEIKEAIKNGTEVAGAEIEERQNLQIKY